MAIPWLSVLKLVPWDEVIRNAPKVADAATRYLGKLGQKGDSAAEAVAQEAARDAAAQGHLRHAPDLAQMQAHLDQAEAAIAELHEQMQASGELINALALQNAQLVERVEKHRVRVLWLGAACGVLALAVIGLWVGR